MLSQQPAESLRPEDIQHACLTYGIDGIVNLKVKDQIATFVATYCRHDHLDETWSFIAERRDSGGIAIKPLAFLSKRENNNPLP